MKLLVDMNLSPRFVSALNDSGFSALRPIVIQIRATQTNSRELINTFIKALNQYEKKLNQGALLTIEEKRTRIRLLPL